ncbi:MAG: DNA polymerase III subunit beta [Bacteroidetes bacterium]|nr:MAG: DNA polymerase III subunit beta [Bacteroidota bacterium]
MNFIVSSTALLKKLQAISGVLSTNNTIPILDNFLFELSENTLKITASDLESTMTVSLNPEKSKADGSVCIPSKYLLDLLKAFSDQPLTFSVNTDNYTVEISSTNGKYQVTGQNPEEFPKIPELENPLHTEIDANILFNAISKTIFATGNDEMRPVMNGVFFQFSKDDAIFVATDAHKLVKYRRTDVKAEQLSSFIMPKKPLNLLKNILANLDGDVSVNYNEKNAQFSIDDISLISRLIEGKYPNYEAVIPKENPHKLTIDRKEFLNAIKRVSIFANKTTHQIRLTIHGNELLLSAEDYDFSNAAKERLSCQYEGEDMEIGFNSRFLMELINNMDSEAVILELSAPNRAGILLPAENDNPNEEILMLVMPVVLNAQ